MISVNAAPAAYGSGLSLPSHTSRHGAASSRPYRLAAESVTGFAAPSFSSTSSDVFDLRPVAGNDGVPTSPFVSRQAASRRRFVSQKS